MGSWEVSCLAQTLYETKMALPPHCSSVLGERERLSDPRQRELVATEHGLRSAVAHAAEAQNSSAWTCWVHQSYASLHLCLILHKRASVRRAPLHCGWGWEMKDRSPVQPCHWYPLPWSPRWRGRWALWWCSFQKSARTTWVCWVLYWLPARCRRNTVFTSPTKPRSEWRKPYLLELSRKPDCPAPGTDAQFGL